MGKLRKKIDSLDKLAAAVTESIEDLHTDMTRRFDGVSDRLSAIEDRVMAVEGKIAGLHRRIDQELDVHKQHDVRLGKIEKHLGLAETTHPA